MDGTIKTLVMLGKPGAGKGTQSGILKEHLRFSPVGYGEFFRNLSKQDTFVARKVGETVDAGKLLPYWLPSFVLMDKMFNEIQPGQGIILDGAARSVAEAKILHEVLTWFERPYKAIYIDISDEEVIKRLTERQHLSGRADDDPEHIQTRLLAFHRDVTPAVEYFKEQGTLLTVNGDQSMDRVTQDILSSLQGLI
jgi:adenylate kinase